MGPKEDQKAWGEKEEKEEYERRAEEWERRRGELERSRGEQGRQGGRRLGGGTARPSRIPRYVGVSAGSSSRLNDGSARGPEQGPSMARRGGVGGGLGALLLSRSQGVARRKEEEVEEGDVFGEGVGSTVAGGAMSSAFASSLITPTADVFGPLPAVVPSASTGVRRRETPARLELSPAGSSSRRPTFLSVARLAGGLSDDDSILAPTPRRHLRRTPVRPTASPDNLLPPPGVVLPDPSAAEAPPVTPRVRQEEGAFAESLKRSPQRAKYDFSRRGYTSSSPSPPPLPPLPSRLVSVAAAAAAQTSSTTITMERSFGAGPVAGEPETPRPATPTPIVEGESWWIHTPSPSPTKMKKMAVRAAKSLGNLRAKMSRANLGGVGDDEITSQATGLAVPPASTPGPVRPPPPSFSSSPHVSSGGRGRVVTVSTPSSQETGRRRRPRLRLSALTRRISGATSSFGGLLGSSSPQVASVGPSPPPRPPRPSSAEVAAAFALLGSPVSPGYQHQHQQQQHLLLQQQQHHHHHHQPLPQPQHHHRHPPQPQQQQPVNRPVTSVLPAHATTIASTSANTTTAAQHLPSSLPPLPASVPGPGPSTTTIKKKKSLAAFLFGRKEKKNKQEKPANKAPDDKPDKGKGKEKDMSDAWF